MQRVSSNLTVFFKLFIPTVWIVFFSTFTAALFFIDGRSLPFLTSPLFKYPFLLGYILFFTLLYYTVMQLKRVELGPDSYYVSNYLKSFRLVYDDVEKISIIPIGRLQLITFSLKAKGSFGKKITFLASKQLYELFMKANPEVETKLKLLVN